MMIDGDFPPLVLLLYLLSFAAAAAGLLLPLMPAGHNDPKIRSIGAFLQILVVTGILPSLQVILDAMEVTPNLPAPWPLTITLIFNSLIITGISGAVLTWSRMAAALFSGHFFTDRIRKPVAYLILLAAAAGILSQVLALTRPSEGTLSFATLSLTVLLVLWILIALDAAARTFILSGDGLPVGLLRTHRGLFPYVIACVILYILLPERGAPAVPPAAMTILFSAMMVLYLKQPRIPETADSVREELFDRSGLTAREREIALMLAEGLSYKEVSEKLFVSLSTIQTHVTRIYGKLGVKSKTELSRLVTGGAGN